MVIFIMLSILENIYINTLNYDGFHDDFGWFHERYSHFKCECSFELNFHDPKSSLKILIIKLYDYYALSIVKQKQSE